MKRTTLFGTLILCMAIGAAHATTYRVPMDFAVIQDAIDASENGDTVLVMPGVYFQRIDLRAKISRSPARTRTTRPWWAIRSSMAKTRARW